MISFYYIRALLILPAETITAKIATWYQGDFWERQGKK
jgi:hypothetical protein